MVSSRECVKCCEGATTRGVGGSYDQRVDEVGPSVGPATVAPPREEHTCDPAPGAVPYLGRGRGAHAQQPAQQPGATRCQLHSCHMSFIFLWGGGSGGGGGGGGAAAAAAAAAAGAAWQCRHMAVAHQGDSAAGRAWWWREAATGNNHGVLVGLAASAHLTRWFGGSVSLRITNF